MGRMYTEMRDSDGKLFWRGPVEHAPMSSDEVTALVEWQMAGREGTFQVVGDYRGLRDPDKVYSVRDFWSDGRLTVVEHLEHDPSHHHCSARDEHAYRHTLRTPEPEAGSTGSTGQRCGDVQRET